MTLELYKSIVSDLPPTPSKFHYIFNLRDLSRIYNGLVLTTPERFTNGAQFARVWRNEVLRVIYDRLIDNDDQNIVNVSKLYLSELKMHDSLYFQELMKKLADDVPQLKPNKDYIFRDPILFGDYRNALDIGEPRIYEDIQDYEAAKALFEQVRHQYCTNSFLMLISAFS